MTAFQRQSYPLEIATNKGEEKKTLQTLKVERFPILFGLAFRKKDPLHEWKIYLTKAQRIWPGFCYVC